MEQQEQVPPVAAPRRRSAAAETTVLTMEDTPYELFMKIHTQAYAATKEGTILDEQGFKDKAFNSYQQALELIDKALQISYGGGFSNDEVNKVEEIVYKMRMTRLVGWLALKEFENLGSSEVNTNRCIVLCLGRKC